MTYISSYSIKPYYLIVNGAFYYPKIVDAPQLSSDHSELCGPAQLRCLGTGWESTWKLLSNYFIITPLLIDSV